MAANDLGGNSGNSASLRHILQDNTSRRHLALGSDYDPTEDLRTGADHDAAPDHRVARARVLASSAQSHALQD